VPRTELENLILGSINLDEADRSGGPAEFMRKMGWDITHFQENVYKHYREPTLILACRQAGKTFCIGGLAGFIAKTVPYSLSAIVCPDQSKSKTLILRAKEIGRKANFQWDIDNAEELGLAGSRILGLPGTVKGVVSNSAKLLVFDEAGLMYDQHGRDLYAAATPMQAHVEEPLTFVISSAWFQEGWFWDEWATGTTYRKVLIIPRWQLKNRKIVPAEMNDKELAAEWKKKNVVAFYSDTPSRAFLEAELQRHPEHYVRQQYFCEFLENKSKVFSSFWLEKAIDSTVKPLFSSPVTKEQSSHGILSDVL
jgi:hypothetical protein